MGICISNEDMPPESSVTSIDYIVNCISDTVKTSPSSEDNLHTCTNPVQTSNVGCQTIKQDCALKLKYTLTENGTNTQVSLRVHDDYISLTNLTTKTTRSLNLCDLECVDCVYEHGMAVLRLKYTSSGDINKESNIQTYILKGHSLEVQSAYEHISMVKGEYETDTVEIYPSM